MPLAKEDIENKVIDWINAGSSGRLTIFKPTDLAGGIDLVIKKRADYKGKEISLQIQGSANLNDAGHFTVDVAKKDINFKDNSYIVFIFFDVMDQDIDNKIWLIPSSDFVSLAKSDDMGLILKFESSESQYAKFLLDKKDLSKVLLEKILVK